MPCARTGHQRPRCRCSDVLSGSFALYGDLAPLHRDGPGTRATSAGLTEYCIRSGLMIPYCPCEDCVEEGNHQDPQAPPTQPSRIETCTGYPTGCQCTICRARQNHEEQPQEPPPELCKEQYYGIPCIDLRCEKVRHLLPRKDPEANTTFRNIRPERRS